MNDVLEFAKSILHGDNKHKAWLMGEAEKWVAQQDKLYFHEDGVEMYPVPQLEGKPLSEAELERIKARNRLERGEFVDTWTLAELAKITERAIDDRASLLQHIAWLTASRGEVTMKAIHQIEDLQREVKDLTAKLTAAEAQVKEIRRRMVRDFYAGTSPDSTHWWACGVCSWTWRDGEAELHERTCPLAQQALSQEAP